MPPALVKAHHTPDRAVDLCYHALHQQQQQQRRAALQQQDAALDQLVYQLYQLTPPEIALVEGTAAAVVLAPE